MNPDNMQAQLITRLIAPIVFSAISTALSSALAAAVFAQPKIANAEEIRTQKPKNNESLNNKQINAIYQILRRAYKIKSKRLEYNDFKIQEPIISI